MFVNALNSHACQVAVEWAYSSIARFYENCMKAVPGKKGYPRFKKNCRSVEYKNSGWKLSEDNAQSISWIRRVLVNSNSKGRGTYTTTS
jgi:putative transposase